METNKKYKPSDFELNRCVYEAVHYAYSINEIIKGDFLKIIDHISNGRYLEAIRLCSRNHKCVKESLDRMDFIMRIFEHWECWDDKLLKENGLHGNYNWDRFGNIRVLKEGAENIFKIGHYGWDLDEEDKDSAIK
jgi:hypothetical protein